MRIPGLAALAAALGAAFVIAPRALAGGPGFSGSVRAAFVDYWRSGAADLTPALARLVGSWARFHTVKAAIAAVLLLVLAALGVALAQAFRQAHRSLPRVALASGAAGTGALALGAVAALLANVQGAVAPLAALLPTLTAGRPDPALAAVLGQVEQRLAGGPPRPPALTVMVDDFARFHLVMAGLAAVTAVLLGVGAAALWRRGPGPGRRALAVLTALPVLALVVLAVANASVAADPAPALLSFVRGGW